MATVATPAVPPGSGSSEHDLAKVYTVVSIVLIALGGALEGLSSSGVALPAWVGLVTMLIGALKGAFTLKTYTASRTAVKVAAQASTGIAVQSLDEAAALIQSLQQGRQ